MPKEEHILIEPSLYDDYVVNAYDKDLNSLLDRPYFCRGYESAYGTAKEIHYTLIEGAPIYEAIQSTAGEITYRRIIL